MIFVLIVISSWSLIHQWWHTGTGHTGHPLSDAYETLKRDGHSTSKALESMHAHAADLRHKAAEKLRKANQHAHEAAQHAKDAVHHLRHHHHGAAHNHHDSAHKAAGSGGHHPDPKTADGNGEKHAGEETQANQTKMDQAIDDYITQEGCSPRVIGKTRGPDDREAQPKNGCQSNAEPATYTISI